MLPILQCIATSETKARSDRSCNRRHGPHCGHCRLNYSLLYREGGGITRGDPRMFSPLNYSYYTIFISYTVVTYSTAITVVSTPTGGHTYVSHLQSTCTSVNQPSINYPLKKSILPRDHAQFFFDIYFPKYVFSMTLNHSVRTNRSILANFLHRFRCTGRVAVGRHS